jgi:putative transposase
VGKKTGPNPTDRGKGGVKRSLLTEAHGMPIAIEIEGANRHDMKLVERTLGQLMIERPEPAHDKPQHLCLDKGYDYDAIRHLVDQFGLTAHIRSRGQEHDEKRVAGARARRWVVERAHSWMNRFRRLLVRWEKKSATSLSDFLCERSHTIKFILGKDTYDDRQSHTRQTA